MAPFSPSSHVYYREFNVYLYSSIKVSSCPPRVSDSQSEHISLSSSVVLAAGLKDPRGGSAVPAVPSLLHHTHRPLLRLPIAARRPREPSALPRLASRFVQQVSPSSPVSILSRLLREVLRLVCCFLLLETLLHVVHVSALLSSPFTVIESLHPYECKSSVLLPTLQWHPSSTWPGSSSISST